MKVSKSQLGHFLEVEWIDAVSEPSKWVGAESADMDALVTHRCFTRGYIIKVGPKAVSMAATWGERPGEAPDLSEIITIPQGMIQGVRNLKQMSAEPIKLTGPEAK